MSVKLIIFDLDGVLLDAKEIHYNALNYALEQINPKYIITKNEHTNMYDGLKTTEKLKLLTKLKGLNINLHNQISSIKQQKTTELLNCIKPNLKHANMLKKLKQTYKLACCSNSIKSTVLAALNKLAIENLFDIILSNEDVKQSKPNPEIFFKAIKALNVLPTETLIVEDSPNGLKAAFELNCSILRVANCQQLDYNYIMTKLNSIREPKLPWQDTNLNVLIPMAGAGHRFKTSGYQLPKPLIDIMGQPMIKRVVDSINIDANYTFICQKDHINKYNLNTLLNLIKPGCKIIPTNGLTEGAACTTLLADDIINNDKPLLIVNSDQIIEYDVNLFMYQMQEHKCDAGILTFKANSPKWSYVLLDKNNAVTKVAEKEVISDIATVGVYYWRRGCDYVSCVQDMIKNNIRVNNEFYVCPAFNEAIKRNMRIETFAVQSMYGVGTPEDLNFYLNKINDNNLTQR